MARTKIGGLVVEVQTSLAKFSSDMNKVYGIAESTAKRVNSSMDTIASGVAGLTAGLTLGKVLQVADEYNTLQQRIRTATARTGDFADVNKQLFNIAQRNGVAFASTVDVFQKLSLGAQQLGASNKQIETVVNAVQQLGAVSGVSGQQLDAALQQLGQALASGRLQGDELKSIMENFPSLAFKIADALKVPVGQLRQMGADGKLVSKDVFQAILKAAPEIGKEFEKIPLSLERSTTKLSNSFQKLIGDIDSDTGATRKLSDAIGSLADNMEKLRPSIEGIAAAGIAFVGVTRVVKPLTDAVVAGGVALVAFRARFALSIAQLGLAPAAFLAAGRAATALWGVLTANPWGLVATGVGLAIGALIMFKDNTITVGKTTATVSAFVVGSWDYINDKIRLAVAGLDAFISRDPSKIAKFTLAAATTRDFDKTVKDAQARMAKAAVNTPAKILPPAADISTVDKKAAARAQRFKDFIADLREHNKELAIQAGNESSLIPLLQAEHRAREILGKDLKDGHLQVIRQIFAETQKLNKEIALNEVSKKLGQEGQELQLILDGRAREIPLLQTKLDFQSRGIQLSQQELAAVEALIERNQSLRDAQVFQDFQKQSLQTIQDLGMQAAGMQRMIPLMQKRNELEATLGRTLLPEELDLLDSTFNKMQQISDLNVFGKAVKDLSLQNEQLRAQLSFNEQNVELVRQRQALEDQLNRSLTTNEAARLSAAINQNGILAKNVQTFQQIKSDLESASTAQEQYNKKIADYREASLLGQISTEQFTKLVKHAKDELSNASTAGKQFASNIVTAFDQAIFQGEKFTNVMSNVVRAIARVAEQKLFIEPLGKLFDVGIGALSKSFLPGHATGGRPSVNKPSLVGERGPEIFVPDRYGSVIPNGRGFAAAGAGAQNVSVQIHNYSGEQVSQQRTVNPDGSENIAVIIGRLMVNEARNNGAFLRELRNHKALGRL